MTRRNLILLVLAGIVLFEVFGREDYGRVMEIHLDVLGAMTNKMAGLAAAGRRPTPHDLTEIVYPLDRARQFVAEYEDQKDRASYASFAELLEVYHGFVLEIDAARGSPEAWERLRPEVEARVAAIYRAVDRTHAVLASEA